VATGEEPRTLLAWLIQTSDRTVDEWADELGQADRGAAITGRHLRRLANSEPGSIGPNPATRRALTIVFGRPTKDLLSPPRALDLTPAPPAAGGLIVPSADLQRSVLAMAAQRANRFSRLTAEGGTSAEVVAQLRDEVQVLTTNYAQRPLTTFLGDLVETQDTIFGAGRATPDSGHCA